MKLTKTLTLGAAIIAISAPFFANAYEKSIVLDARGNAVTTKDGVCVTHNWPESNPVCDGGLALGIPNVVYFDFARSSLNAKGQQVVAEAAAGITKLGGNYKVTLSGHADRVDTAAFNQRLSERRAATVKAALVAKGVNPAAITTSGFGESRNAVPTQDNVPEQLNRRVEIQVSQ